MSSTHRTGFLALPEELLTSIVEAYVQSVSDTGFRHLKDLRLVHPRLGHLKRLKRQLFYKIYLRPDPRRLAAQDVIKSIAPHTSHVVFEPVTLRRSSCQALSFSVMKARQQYERAVFALMSNGAVVQMALVLRAMSQLRSATVTQAKLSSDKDELVPPGDALLSLVIQSIALADVQVEDFFIEHHPYPDFAWARRLPGWQKMAVNKLKTLNFHPSTDTREEIAWQYHPDPFGQTPPPLVAGLEPDRTLTELLRRCSSSLEVLSCRSPALVLGQSWNTGSRPHLPALRRLDVADCLIHGPLFGEWLLSCVSLNVMNLTRLRPRQGDQLIHWRPVFDSIRNHENDIAVTFDNVDVWAGLRWRLCLQYHTSRPTEELTACFPRMLCGYLKDYTTGIRGWLSEEEQQTELDWA